MLILRAYNEIVESNKRAFLFRDVALELYFSDKRNFLIVFKDKRERQIVVQRLSYKNDARDAITKSVIGNFVLDTMSKAIDKSEQQLEAMTRKWQTREISNVRLPSTIRRLLIVVRILATVEPVRESYTKW